MIYFLLPYWEPVSLVPGLEKINHTGSRGGPQLAGIHTYMYIVAPVVTSMGNGTGHGNYYDIQIYIYIYMSVTTNKLPQ